MIGRCQHAIRQNVKMMMIKLAYMRKSCEKQV